MTVARRWMGKKQVEISLNITNRLHKHKMENHIRRGMARKRIFPQL